MTILELSREEFGQRLDTLYNPPDSSVSDKEFEIEYYRLYDKLEEFMALQGQNDAYGQGDYYLASSIMRSRGMGFEVTNSKIVTMELLRVLQTLVAENAPEWEICFRSDNFDYDVFVSSSAVRIYRNSPDLLPKIAPAKS